MTAENRPGRPGIPVPSSTVEYGGMRIEKGVPGETVYGSKDVIIDGGDTASTVTPVTTKEVAFSPRNPAYTDGDGVRHEYPERVKVPH